MPFRPVFLSHVNDPETTPLFPGDPGFTMTAVKTIVEDGYYLQTISEGEHTGTHWGAPVHFDPEGLTADRLDPDDLLRPAVVVDVRPEAAADADYGVTVADLQAFEVTHGRIPDGAAVLLWTGWDRYWGTPQYANEDARGVVHQPGFTVDAVRWLLDSGRLGRQGALGSDTFGPDRGVDEDYGVSRLVYGGHRITLENLANLHRMPPTGAWVLAGGTRNRHGSGSPATIFGLVPR
jgi:kynurenine formamidase